MCKQAPVKLWLCITNEIYAFWGSAVSPIQAVVTHHNDKFVVHIEADFDEVNMIIMTPAAMGEERTIPTVLEISTSKTCKTRQHESRVQK